MNRERTGIFVEGQWQRDWYDSFEDQDFCRWLREHGIRVPLFEYRYGIYRALVKQPLFPEHTLPRGVWYKGGCARAILQDRFALPVIPPNDVDLLVDEAVALHPTKHGPLPLQKPDDLEYVPTWPRYTIEQDNGDNEIYTDEPRQEAAFEDYFFTRDFQVNEVLANEKELYFTKEALVSAVEKSLVCTHHSWYEARQRGDQAVKLLAKSLRFSLEWDGFDAQHPWNIDRRLFDLIDPDVLEHYAFFVLLALDRALKRDESIGHQYLALWQEYGFFPTVRSTYEFATYLLCRTRRDYRPESPYLRTHWKEILRETNADR